MKIETIEKKIYSVEDLKLPENEELKEKVLNKWRESNFEEDDLWYYFTLEDLVEELNDIGFQYSDIYFRGFWSQGDGASFDCSDFNIEKLCNHLIKIGELTEKEKSRILRIEDYFLIEINKTHWANHYCHYNTRDLTVEFGVYNKDYKHIEQLVQNFEDKLEALREDLCKQIYRRLEKDYYAQQEDAYIMEVLEANEYEFTENGCIY